MADTTANFDFSQFLDQDDPFLGTDFSNILNPEIETGLAADCPVQEVQKVAAQEEAPASSVPAWTPEEIEAIIASASKKPSINPELLSSNQPTYVDPSCIDTNTQNTGSYNNNQQIAYQQQLNNAPNFTFQPPDNQQYSQYPCYMSNQFGGNSAYYPQQAPAQMYGAQLYHDPTMAQVPVQGTGYPPGMMNTQMNSQFSYPQQQLANPQINPYQQAMPPQQAVAPAHQTVHQPNSKAARRQEGNSPESHDPSALSAAYCGRDYRKGPPSVSTVTTTSALPKRPDVNHNGVALRNDKIPRKTHGKRYPQDVEPENYYGPSPSKPEPWGPLTPKGQHLFTYTEKGELAPGLYLTRREMKAYLLGPENDADFQAPKRLPGSRRVRGKRRQGLTLWIGWPAAMANSRYPRGGESTKCRFKECQYKHTIALGEPWVIFDERMNVKGECVDPFHNAGYVHLYCLEHHFDLIDLWQLVDVRVDDRVFKRESYPYFNLENKLPGIDAEVRGWWDATMPVWLDRKVQGKKRVRDHKSSLSQRLIKYKLNNEPRAQARNRAKRGGVDMSKHEGDPELKRKYKAMQKHKLLDAYGMPIKGAEEELERIENKGDGGRRKSVAPTKASSPCSPQLMQYQAQQFQPYPKQEFYVKQEESKYAAQPVYHQPANHPYLHQPVPQYPYDASKVLNMPTEPVTGQKRCHDNDEMADQTLPTTSPKRIKLEAEAETVLQNIPVEPSQAQKRCYEEDLTKIDPILLSIPPPPQVLEVQLTAPQKRRLEEEDEATTADTTTAARSPKRQRLEGRFVPPNDTKVDAHSESAPQSNKTTEDIFTVIEAKWLVTAQNNEELAQVSTLQPPQHEVSQEEHKSSVDEVVTEPLAPSPAPSVGLATAQNNEEHAEVSIQQSPHDVPQEEHKSPVDKAATEALAPVEASSPPLSVGDIDDLFGAPEDDTPDPEIEGLFGEIT
ncbi:hypothetical protein F5Y01DRAFT_330334 [Xylaria sp. FL0043]|nr:hypothetical protein F5Y01DRAFT_330334 [Xylaria sp. FL0043]